MGRVKMVLRVLKTLPVDLDDVDVVYTVHGRMIRIIKAMCHSKLQKTFPCNRV